MSFLPVALLGGVSSVAMFPSKLLKSTTLQFFSSSFSSSSSPSWLESIRHCTSLGLHRQAVSIYFSLLHSGCRPCPFCIASTLKSLSHLSPSVAPSFHSHLIRLGLLSHPYPLTALSHLYSLFLPTSRIHIELIEENGKQNVVCWNNILGSYLRMGDFNKAREVFDGMPVKDVVTYNSMIFGLSKAGQLSEANEMFCSMTEKNPASWNALISGYMNHGNMTKARKLFDEMPMRNNISCITMISGYAKHGNVNSAQEIFSKTETNDIFVWNSMISCYSQNGYAIEAIHLFNRMRKPQMCLLPDRKTFSCVISSCSQLGDLRFGSWIRNYMGILGIELDDHLTTALLDLYSKCGDMDRAFELFEGLNKKDVVSYSSMILGCGTNGMLDKAISLFKEMLVRKISPNEVTFVGLLTAYNHAGLVEEARNCFDSMYKSYKIKPIAEHYAILVDVLGRSGRLRDAYKVINEMPMMPQVNVWGSLLLACRLHNNEELGEIAAKKCLDLAPNEAVYYVLLANIYNDVGRYDKARKLRKVMVRRGLSKIPGSSWVDSA